MFVVPYKYTDAKRERMARCNKKDCGTGGSYLCGRCRRLRQKMCREYHNIGLEVERAYNDDTTSPTELSRLAWCEMEHRLLYEYTFNILTDEDMKGDGWLHGGNRDVGHRERVRKLWRLCGGM